MNGNSGSSELTREAAINRAICGLNKIDNMKSVVIIMHLIENEVKKQEEGN